MKMIIAYDLEYGIGINDDLLYHFHEDLKRFKKMTYGCPIVMGRKTYESLPSKLHNRKHIVLSKDPVNFVVNSFVPDLITDEIKKIASEYNDAWVIGGSTIYKEMVKYCDILEITKIYSSRVSDTKVEWIKDILVDYDNINTETFYSIDSIEKEKIKIEFLTYKKRS